MDPITGVHSYFTLIGVWYGACRFIPYCKELDRVRSLKKRTLDEEKQVMVIWGAPQTGKSSWVRAHFNADEMYVKEPSSRWWDGYTNQAVVWFDEPTDIALSLEQFKCLCDPLNLNGLKMEQKGRVCWVNPQTIIFTSNNHPTEWFKRKLTDYDREAIVRRFTRSRVCYPGDKLWEERDIWHFVQEHSM